MPHTVYEVNAFTANGKNGNPAGVVLDADQLVDRQMQEIATAAGFSETTFVRSHGSATHELRFFTRTNEVDICGHATIAAWSLLHQKGLLPAGEYRQQTRAGQLGIAIMESGLVFMEQKPAEFYEEVPVPLIAPLAGVSEARFHGVLRPQIVSTGLRDLLIPVKDKSVLTELSPNLPAIEALSGRYKVSAWHFFDLLEGMESAASTRNFAPIDGIDEEAATGTSNGALLCYLRRQDLLPDREIYRIEQGQAMGQLSYIYGKFVNDVVWIGGAAALMRETEITTHAYGL